MLAAGKEPVYAGSPGGELRQEVNRSPIQRPRIRNNRSPSPRPVPSEYLTASENTENRRRWEKRNGIQPTARRVNVPKRTLSPSRPTLPPREPLAPGTQVSGGPMNFTLDHSQSKSHEGEDQDTGPPAPSRTSASPETVGTVGPRQSLAPRGTHRAPVRLPGTSIVEIHSPEVLTWGSALNSILSSDAIDPVTREIVSGRTQRKSIIRSSEHRKDSPIAPIDVCLVPSFSYPISGSGFYDHTDVVQIAQTQSVEDGNSESRGQQHEELLPNGVGPGHYSRSSSNDTLYRNPTPPDWPLRGGQSEDHPRLTNGVSPGYYPPSSPSDSSTSSIDPRRRPSSPSDPVPEQVFILLCSILTPSELALHHQIIYGEDLAPNLPSNPLATPSNAASPTPLDIRLIQKLDTAVCGLQDRVTGLEEDLVPQLSKWLEQKERQIDDLKAKSLGLTDEVAQLKRIVDLSTRTLHGCQERELEVWGTLVDIRRKRGRNRTCLARLFATEKSSSASEFEMTGKSVPDGYVVSNSPSASAKKNVLKKKELDALLIMARQNFGILLEEMRDVAGMVQAYQAGKDGFTEVGAPAEGSSRDV
ncbi:hypothetical protein DDE83_003654 [Stemphylium lycopersici]|uniref:Uncharacterized protein n=1 Tax=Stemphylium lycopersici TaxID=183478 RepID=A0A364N6P9_STELY|nr:hypothetical protein DDE83_003654 [Stemphylium lycopersici]